MTLSPSFLVSAEKKIIFSAQVTLLLSTSGADGKATLQRSRTVLF